MPYVRICNRNHFDTERLKEHNISHAVLGALLLTVGYKALTLEVIQANRAANNEVLT